MEDQIGAKALAGEINAFLAAQPLEKRRLFVRRYFYFDSVQDIADRYDMKESTVKSTLLRMRRELAKRLDTDMGGIR